MKVLVALLIVFPYYGALAQPISSLMPHDGRYWRTMSHVGKITYLSGYSDGTSEGTIESTDPKQPKEIDARLKHLFPSNLSSP